VISLTSLCSSSHQSASSRLRRMTSTSSLYDAACSGPKLRSVTWAVGGWEGSAWIRLGWSDARPQSFPLGPPPTIRAEAKHPKHTTPRPPVPTHLPVAGRQRHQVGLAGADHHPPQQRHQLAAPPGLPRLQGALHPGEPGVAAGAVGLLAQESQEGLAVDLGVGGWVAV
jgi:hypothetical protein